MDLFDNPFYLIGANVRDDRGRILELSEMAGLQQDPELSTAAGSTLIHPVRRLSAEVTWLPGVPPKQSAELLDLLKRESSIPHIPEDLPALARINILSAALIRMSDEALRNAATDVVLELAVLFESLNADHTLALINADRVAAGVPEVADLSLLDLELKANRKNLGQIILAAFDRLLSVEVVRCTTDLIEKVINNTDGVVPVLVTDLIDAYEVRAQTFVEQEAKTVECLLADIRQAVSNGRAEKTQKLIDQLELVLKNWNLVLRPLQLLGRKRGTGHEASIAVALSIRNVSVQLYNEYDSLDYSSKLNALLKRHFSEHDDIAEIASDDESSLQRISAKTKESEKRQEEWNKEICYETQIGLIRKKTFRITPETLEWDNRSWSHSAINKFRWGGISHSLNGVPTGTTYYVSFTAQTASGSIEVKKSEVFHQITERLWKVVGVRLLLEMLIGLREGKRCKFGPVIVEDKGIRFERTHWFSATESIFRTWSQLLISNGAGTFCIFEKGEKRPAIQLGYLDIDNVHVLEAAMRTFWKQGGERLSDILES